MDTVLRVSNDYSPGLTYLDIEIVGMNGKGVDNQQYLHQVTSTSTQPGQVRPPRLG